MFVDFIPGLAGSNADFTREPEKVTMLRNAGINVQVNPYQTAATPAASYDAMVDAVTVRIMGRQYETGHEGIVVASSVGAAVLMGALRQLSLAGRPAPHVILIGPVHDLQLAVQALAGPAYDKLMKGEIDKIDIPVSGDNQGTFPVTREFINQFTTHRHGGMLPTLPGFTLMVGDNDPYCPPKVADALFAAMPADEKRRVFWKGGHNENTPARDDDIIAAVQKAMRAPRRPHGYFLKNKTQPATAR